MRETRRTRSMIKIPIALLALVVLSPPAHADDSTRITGTILEKTCATEGTSPICSAYFLGFMQGIRMSNGARQVGKPICLPDLSADSLRSEFMSFAARHSELLDQDANILIGGILMKEYSCPNSN